MMEAVDTVEQRTAIRQEDVRHKRTQSSEGCNRRRSTTATPVFPAQTHLLTDHREDERVGEVLIQREFDHVSAQLQETSGLRQADEDVNAH